MIITKLTFLTFFCILLILSIIILYASKKRLKTNEALIFKIMCYSNLIALILQFIISQTSYYYDFVPKNISDMLIKSYIFMLVFFGLLLLCYLIDLIVKKAKPLNLFVSFFYVLLSTVIFFLPLDIYIDNKKQIYYSYGLANDYASMLSLLASCAIFMLMFFNIGKLKKRKVVPIITYLTLCFICFIIQLEHPEFVIICFVESFLCFIMYHSIENPDMRLIEKLNVAKDEAEKANRAKSDFLSSMSHEIRTPLNAIAGLSEDILTYKNDVPKQVREDCEDIIEASNTLLEIVGNILNISKIESNKLDIVQEPYRFAKEITNLVKINKTRIGEKPIELKLELAEDIPYELIGDKIHVKEVINNLLSNAIKYTEEGTVYLRVKCINKDNKCNLFISVEDTGRGIKKEYINRLFEKFDRLDIDKKTTIEGTGLGLAITKKLVSMMGGTINVSSVYGKGSIFVVNITQTISKMTKPEEEKVIVTKENKVDYSKKKILVVDDNLLNLKVANRALSDLQIKIDEVTSGMDAIKKVKENKYDVILLDIMMPEMNGEETLKKLKELPGFNIPVIAVTADALEGAKEKYLKEGFNQYVAKPFTRDQIKEKLDRVFIKDSK